MSSAATTKVARGFLIHSCSMEKMNGYNLIRAWYNFKFENPSRTSAKHSDFYCYLIDQWNRLGQKKEFGLPTSYTMECLNIGSYNTYKKTLNDLVEFGFIKIIKDSKNQHQSKIIALSKIDKATDKALDKATIKATDKAIDTITKQYNKGTKEQMNNNIVKINFDDLLTFFNQTFHKQSRVINDKIKRKYQARLKEGYTKDDIAKSMRSCSVDKFHKESNFKYCTLEFFSRSETIDKYGFNSESKNNYIATK